jgi:AraC-like DNA-binding protein
MPETIDVILRTISVMVAVLLAGLLLATARRHRAALPGALFALAAAAFFVTSVPGSAAELNAWFYPLTALCVSKAAWFWLFAKMLFNDDARLMPRHLAIAGAVAVIGTWQQTVFVGQFRAGSATPWETVIGFGFDAALLAFVVLGLWEAWRDLSVDLVERRRRLRLGFMIATGAYLALALGVQTGNLLNGINTPVLVARANAALVAAVFLAAAACLLQLRSASWLEPSRATRAVALNRVEAAVLAQLERALVHERIHLQEDLTIGALARHLRTGEHVLRRVINAGMGYRNFRDFLHTWRIREACAELARPEQARQPVLSIAMKVGYGSVGPFNRAFKARVGMTPTAYRRRNTNGAFLAGSRRS